MNFIELSEFIAGIPSQNYFVLFEPEILDFTQNINITIKLFGIENKQFIIELDQNNFDMNFRTLIQFLIHSVFSKGSRVITWNWKNFASFVLAKTGKLFTCEGILVDLKILESYSGIKKVAPKNLSEALFRIKSVMASENYKNISKIYKTIHVPLINEVIPRLETVGIIDKQKNAKVYAYYEIDGQENGRLLCHDAFLKSYLPHNLSDEKKTFLKPLEDNFFMYFDYSSMEVFQLAWLTQDPQLLVVCSESDVYSGLYKMIIGNNADSPEKRNQCKKFFLPVIYGMSAPAIADRLKLSESTAQSIFDRIHSLFKVSFEWLSVYENFVQKNGYADDIFGKRRYFSDKHYRVRNFAIQSPASIVCLEKLIDLNNSLKSITKLAYHVHDGYVIYATKDKWKEIYNLSMATLTAESQLCKGLKLNVSAKAGRELNSLKNIIKKEKQ